MAPDTGRTSRLFRRLVRDGQPTRTASADAAATPAGACVHLASTDADPDPRDPRGCEECLRDGTDWVHLRLCLECGHVGCCDSSPQRHASRHYAETGHPVIRSFEPGETWRWCFVHDLLG
jgi:monovalent cation/hydrogen antiporter